MIAQRRFIIHLVGALKRQLSMFANVPRESFLFLLSPGEEANVARENRSLKIIRFASAESNIAQLRCIDDWRLILIPIAEPYQAYK